MATDEEPEGGGGEEKDKKWEEEEVVVLLKGGPWWSGPQSPGESPEALRESFLEMSQAGPSSSMGTGEYGGENQSLDRTVITPLQVPCRLKCRRL